MTLSRPRLDNLLTIRRHLLLLLALLALPFLAFLLISSQRQADHDRELAGQQMLALARLTSSRLDDYVGDIRQLLSVLSTVVGTTPADSDRNDAILRGLTRRLPPQINNLSVWTADGVNIGTMDPRLRATGLNVVKRKFFRDAMATGLLSVEAPVTSVSNGKMIGIFALRIERSGQPLGVVAVSAQLEHLQNLLAKPGTLPDGSVITVTDISGAVLARSIEPDQWIGKNLLGAPGGLAESLKKRSGMRDGPGADGVDRIAGFTMADRVPWLVYVGIPTETALVPVRTRLHENIAAGAAMLLLGLLLSSWVAHRISAPLTQLATDAAVLERGDLAHRSTVRSGGEIGLLASTLNRMADALQQRTASLQASEARLRQLAEHDTLTGLPNRALFHERLDIAIARATRQRSQLALLFLDIDHFKSVNDTLGHEAGDDLLQAFARRLLATVRKTDTVARLAGDEFTVILDAPGDLAGARRVAEALVEKSRRSVGSGDRLVAISTSIGLAMWLPGETATSLLRRADAALYAAKAAGRDRCACAENLPAGLAAA